MEIEQSNHARIRQEIRRCYKYSEDNHRRWHTIRRFILASSISQGEKIALEATGKPPAEFNFLEAILSRQCGEFSQQEPSIYVNSVEGVKNNEKTNEFLEGYIRYKIEDAKQETNATFKAFHDSLSGGFSCWKYYPDYASPGEFKLIVKVEKVADPTKVYFDYASKQQHKADSRFWFEMHALTKKEIKAKWGITIKENNYSSYFDDYPWAFKLDNEEIFCICEWYEVIPKQVKIVELTSGHKMTKKKYDKFLELWKESGRIDLPPSIRREKTATFNTIKRTLLTSEEILEEEDTDYEMPNYVYVDGNSVLILNEDQTISIMSRPYLYHAIDIQRFKNLMGQSIYAHVQNMGQHQWMFAKESIPDEQGYRDAIVNVQTASTIVYNQFVDGDKDKPTNPPQQIQRVSLPSEVLNSFSEAERTAHATLGIFDGSAALTNDISGEAIVKGAMQSNPALLPYLINYMNSLAQLAKGIVSLTPKIIGKDEKGQPAARDFPILQSNGELKMQSVNGDDKDSIKLNYDANNLKVRIEAGVNFEIQKIRNMDVMRADMASNPAMAEFFSTVALDLYFDNLAVKKANVFKERAIEFMQEKKAQIAQQQQMQQQMMANNPQIMKIELEKKKLELQVMQMQQEAQQKEVQAQLEMAKIMLEKSAQQNDALEIMNKSRESDIEAAIAFEKSDAEKVRAHIDLAMQLVRDSHKHNKEAMEHFHKVDMDVHDRLYAMKEADRAHDITRRKEEVS